MMHIVRRYGLVVAITVAGCATDQTEEFTGLSSVVHGEPGARPFWNIHAGRYIYPPSISWTDTTASVQYQLSINGNAATTQESWINLATLWDELETGFVTIAIRGLDDDGETVFRDSLTTIKSPGFRVAAIDDYQNPGDEGLLGLRTVLALEKVRHWLDPGGPDPSYPLWVHPSKLMGMLSQNMLYLSQIANDVQTADEALRVSREAASFLLSLREPEDTPLAGWTHTYWDGVDRGAHPIWMDQIMTNYPSEAALAFLDLFDETADSTWYDASLLIANTYRRVQREDGTWNLLMRRSDGSGVGEKLMIPVSVLTFLDRLHNQYGVEDFVSVRNDALNWIMRNPVQAYAWEAQFEDTRPKRRYRNLSQRPAAGFAQVLFESSSDPADLRLAHELMLFVEDQFIVWDHSDPVTRTNWFRPEMKWNGNRPDGTPGKDWFLPAILEQYAFYTPIAWGTADVIYAYCAGYDATGNEEYRSKARALSQSLISAQEYHGTGEIPTHLREVLPEVNWLNNSTYSARALMEASCL